MIKVKFYAILREIMGKEEISFLASNLSCEAILLSLKNQFPNLAPVLASCLVAVNGSYASPGVCLFEGDELALLPPVSGG